MSHLNALQSAKSLYDVAVLLGFKPAALAYILYVKPATLKYKKFEVPKRSGGTRNICAPLDDLKLLQRRLANLLQNCLDEITEAKAPRADRISHGFRRNRSIITNARQHRHRRYVLNLDLHDFFGSINFGRVRGLFLKHVRFQLDPKVATVLAQIACFENALPQGSPCSPVVSNFVGHILDIHLVSLAQRNGCLYSRYADDLTFSTNQPRFPSNIAMEGNSGRSNWKLGVELLHLIHLAGFQVNPNKTRMQYRNSRQEVTGLVVNEKVNVRREYRHNVRAMVHSLFTRGHFVLCRGSASGFSASAHHGTAGQLRGMLGFIDGVDLLNRHVDSKLRRQNPSTKELVYRRFLMFNEFYAASQPTIICEGKTDNVYLTHAIRALASLFPKLAVIRPDGSVQFCVRRFRYAGTSTGRILGLGGGAPDLARFVSTYRADCRRFHASGLREPVIVVVDNDSGAHKLFSVVKEVTGKKPTGREAFIHAFKNLYVVPTPLGARSESKIEDFFDSATTSIKLNGKEFNSANDFDAATQYGKADFAYRVIQPNADKIDFSLFTSLLANITAAIEYHKGLTTP